MKYILLICAFVLSSIATFGQADTNSFYKPHTWTTLSGKQVRAIYVRQDNERAFLRNRNGQELQISKDLLNEECQAFLASIYNFENPPKEIIPPPTEIPFSFPEPTPSTVMLVEISRLGPSDKSDSAFPFNAKWTEFALPITDQEKTACREITTELKQISKALDIGISYDEYSKLVQDVALKIERIKDSTATLPSEFIKRAELTVSCHANARDSWHKSIFSDSDSSLKSDMEMFRKKYWDFASMQLLYCQAIANRDPNINNDILLHAAKDIITDELIWVPFEKRLNIPSARQPNPYIADMKTSELLLRVRNLAAVALPQKQELISESTSNVEQAGPEYPPQSVGSSDP